MRLHMPFILFVLFPHILNAPITYIGGHSVGFW